MKADRAERSESKVPASAASEFQSGLLCQSADIAEQDGLRFICLQVSAQNSTRTFCFFIHRQSSPMFG